MTDPVAPRLGWWRGWWRRRTLPVRITVVATGVALACLLAVTGLTGSTIGWVMVGSADGALRPQLDSAADQVAAGATLAGQGGPIRLLDTAGDPLDGRPRPDLSTADLRQLKSGVAVLTGPADAPSRWLGRVVITPDGTPRLVVAGAELVGFAGSIQRGTQWLALAAALVAVLVGLATWLAARSSLLPVERMRLAAGALPRGERLPVPEARDELRALAEALNAMLARRDDAAERLRRFTGDAAHELRNPVASVRAQAEVAVAHPDPEFSLEVLESVVEESERLSALVEALLVLARADAGELPRAQPVDLALAASAAIAREAGSRVRVQLDAPLSAALVAATPAEVALVLDNLLRNAVRHAAGTVRVSVLPAIRQVRLLVDDDGAGVPPEHRARVFDRFYRVDDARGRASGGFGLGLAMVAQVVRGRGGSVRVGESPEGGARFEIRWPLWI